LEIIAPKIEDVAPAAAAPPRNIIAGFLLDNSGSMQGRKIQHAINTIKQLAEILLSERDGKTIATQPIHSWIYVITFNSDAELVIPFQEITADTLPNILTQLDQIRTIGCTNYERAFKKQTEVIADIRGIPRGYRPPTAVAMLDKPVGGASTPTTDDDADATDSLASARSYHLIRFFGTDGEITEGLRSTEILYKMMRDTDAAYLNDTATTDATTDATTTDATTSTAVVGVLAPPTGLSNEYCSAKAERCERSVAVPPLGGGTPRVPAVGGRYPRGTPLTFEDYVLGYGTDVDLNCLQTLASPYQRSEYLADRSHANRKRQYTDAYNCSSLITIIKPEDIGWQMGELLFKVIMRYGYKVQVSISTAAPFIELFEYQSHSWSNSTTLHSIIHGETKPLYIQYTPPDAATATAAATALVKVQYSNQFTGSTYTYEFEHTIIPSPTTDAATYTDVSVPDLPILGMIQIEIFKQFREIEAGSTATGGSKYDKDTIVREAYKTLRMLKSLDAITPQHENLITDVKVIIGLTTIQNKKETDMILHARRICSAEQEIFNTGANISRKYIDGEEDYEEEAARVINAHNDKDDKDDNDDNDDNDELVSDALPSRIPTVLDTPYSQNAVADYGGSRRYHRCEDGSELRTLCARIAMAKKHKEDFTTEQLYDQVRRYGSAAGHHQHNAAAAAADDQFSSTPMDDEYTQRRMGMMRQMSSASQSKSQS
jgi:hypothetical protein